MGVSGCGKTTIGKSLAEMLHWQFIDADDFHPETNIEKMRKGLALTDDDRLPWLQSLGSMLANRNRAGENTLLACSALKQAYRETLGVDQQSIVSVLLQGTFEQVQARLKLRSHAFMNDDLLINQFETLEVPGNGLTVDITSNPRNICKQIITLLDIN